MTAADARVVRHRVDVGIVTWNTAAMTSRALQHLAVNDQGCDLRVFVYDNGSSDGTVEAIRAAHPRVEVEAGTENLGFAAGVNRLLARSDAPWFVALNSDAWPEPGAIATLLDAAQAHPDAAVVAPRLVRPDGALEHSTYPFPSLRVAAIMASLNRVTPEKAEAMALEGYWHHDRAREVDWAIGACWLMRRVAIDDVGALDERFFMYAEDLEWCWRAHKRGWRVWFEPAAVVRHVGNASGASAYGAARTEVYLRNTHRLYRAEHGLVSASAYRALNAWGAARRWAHFARRRNRDMARLWARQLRVHLTPAGGADGPPAL